MTSFLDRNRSTGLDRAMNLNSMATGTFNRTQPDIPLPKKTIGGGVGGALGGAAAGAAIGTTLGGPVIGTGIGAVAGLAQYYLS